MAFQIRQEKRLSAFGFVLSLLSCFSFYISSLGNEAHASTWNSYSQAWIYPGPPACSAPTTYNTNPISTLKPEYMTVSPKGQITILDVNSSGCNAYSAQNAADIKAHSYMQFVTVSGGFRGYTALIGSATNRTAATTAIVNFLTLIGFTGVELDFESYGSWTATQYSNYKLFLTQLGTALHANKFLLMVDGPAISDASDQSNYKWKYEDIAPLADYVVALTFDYQYDYGAGNPVAPNKWVTNSINWVKSKVSNMNNIVIGIPAYGYHGATGNYNITIDTEQQSSAFPGFATAVQDPNSFEMYWVNQGISYFYQNTAGLNLKRTLIESLGVQNISVWHLGGNEWFSGQAEPIPVVPIPVVPIP